MKAALCIEMGWTSQQFDAQPWSFISSILHTFKSRAQDAERAAYQARIKTR